MATNTASLRARLLRLALALLPLLTGARQAYASLYDVRLLAPETMAQEADVVVLGNVDDVQSAWMDGRIVTTVTLTVEGTLKGSARSKAVFKVGGGKVGDIAMKVSSEPAFSRGERSVVFLKATQEDPQASSLRLYGGHLGKIPIEQDAAGRDTVRWLRPELQRVDVVPLGAFAQHLVDVVAKHLLDTVKRGAK